MKFGYLCLALVLAFHINSVTAGLPKITSTQGDIGGDSAGGGDFYVQDFSLQAKRAYRWLKKNGAHLNPPVDAEAFLSTLEQALADEKIQSTPEEKTLRTIPKDMIYTGDNGITYLIKSRYPLEDEKNYSPSIVSSKMRGVAHEIFLRMDLPDKHGEISNQMEGLLTDDIKIDIAHPISRGLKGVSANRVAEVLESYVRHDGVHYLDAVPADGKWILWASRTADGLMLLSYPTLRSFPAEENFADILEVAQAQIGDNEAIEMIYESNHWTLRTVSLNAGKADPKAVESTVDADGNLHEIFGKHRSIFKVTIKAKGVAGGLAALGGVQLISKEDAEKLATLDCQTAEFKTCKLLSSDSNAGGAYAIVRGSDD